MPWLEYFRKIAAADIFVFLDDSYVLGKNIGFLKKATFLASDGRVVSYGLPVLAGGSARLVSEVEIALSAKPYIKSKRQIQEALSSAPFWHDYSFLIAEYYSHRSNRIAVRNQSFIESVMGVLGIKTRISLSSALNLNSQGEARIIDICLSHGADRYISGQGAATYQVPESFRKNGIRLSYKVPLRDRTLETTVSSREQLSTTSILGLLCWLGAPTVRELVAQPTRFIESSEEE